MTLREKIEVMEAFERGEEIEHRDRLNDMWFDSSFPDWSWKEFEYRIKPKPKQKVTIEKWLVKSNFDFSFQQVVQTDSIDNLCYCCDYTKVELLDTQDVELSCGL